MKGADVDYDCGSMFWEELVNDDDQLEFPWMLLLASSHLTVSPEIQLTL
jgi:hypothetical protein